MTDGERIIEIVRQREQKLLASSSLMLDLQNPFQRPAITAGDIAWKLGWTTTTKSGCEKQDTQRVKKEIARLCAAGHLVEVGSFRTMHAGSKTTVCFSTPGFMERREHRISELTGKPASNEIELDTPTPRP